MSTPEQAVVGTEALKGLAHPLRLRLIAELNARGSATASQLAAALGESSGSTSYHLRQLHRHGFVEEDPERGTARERVWVPRPGGWSIPVLDLAEDPSSAVAVDVLLREQLREEHRRVLEMVTLAREWPPEWRDAAVRRETHVSLDPARLAAMREELDAVVDRYREEEGTGDARRVSVVYQLIPTEHRTGT